jgi:bifunctional DNA primase/polymerase-like protein
VAQRRGSGHTSEPSDQKAVHQGLAEDENTFEQIAEWGREFPHAMVGVLAGEPSGFFAIDLDRHPDENGNIEDGFEALGELEAKRGQLPPTQKTATPGNGRHIKFKSPPGVRIPNRAKQFAPGIDVRSITSSSATATFLLKLRLGFSISRSSTKISAHVSPLATSTAPKILASCRHTNGPRRRARFAGHVQRQALRGH